MYISLSWTGNSSSMVISVGLHDENPRNNPNTAPHDGNVKLFMQKDRDVATAQELFDAEVKNGRWQSPAWDLSNWKKEGFDTLVAQYPGLQPVYRRLVTTQMPASQTGNARQTQKKVSIDFTGVELTKKSDGKKYDVEVSGKILADGQPLCQTQLDFFWKGRIEPACQLSPGLKTDDNGRFSFVYTDKPAEGARIKMEVQVRGGASRQYELDMPTPPQEAKKAAAPKPTALVALLVSSMLGADKVSHRIALVCKDQNEKPIDCGFVYWTAGKDGGELDLSKGAATHTVEIAVPEANIPYTVWSPNFGLSLPTPLTLTGPAKKTETNHVYVIDADLDSPHPVGGKFVVVGTTSVNGKLQTCECIVSSSPEDVVVESRLGKVEPGSDPNTYKLTSSGGNFKLTVPATFTNRWLELQITAPDGTSKIVPMIRRIA